MCEMKVLATKGRKDDDDVTTRRIAPIAIHPLRRARRGEREGTGQVLRG